MLCLTNLKDGKSVPQSLRLLARIFGSYNRREERDGISAVIAAAEKEYHLFDTFFANLHAYHQHVKQELAKLPAGHAVDINTMLIGKWQHLQHIRERFEFLDFTLGNSDLSLAPQQLDALWQSIVVQGLTVEERDLGLQWIETSRSTTNNKEYASLTDESIEYIFDHKFAELDFAALTVQGLNAFEFLFRIVNAHRKKIVVYESRDKEYAVLSFELDGLALLWRIVLECRHAEVGKSAVQLMTRLYKSLAPDLKPQLVKLREEFIAQCMAYLSGAAKEFAVKPDAALSLRIVRCLTLLKSLIEAFEGSSSRGRHGAKSSGMSVTLNVVVLNGNKFSVVMTTADTVGQLRQKIAENMNESADVLRLLTTGKELKNDGDTLADLRLTENQVVHVTRYMRRAADGSVEAHARPSPSASTSSEKEDDEMLPSRQLAQERYFAQLFDLLILPGSIGQLVWDLLMKLRTNPTMLDSLQRLRSPHDTDPAHPNWNELLDPRSLFKLLYALQIVESLLQPEGEESWRQQFVLRGGVTHLIHVLSTSEFLDESKGSKRLACLVLLLKTVSAFVLTRNALDVPQFTEVLARSGQNVLELLSKLMHITWSVAKLPNDSRTDTAVPAAVSEDGSNVLSSLLERTESEPEQAVKHAMPLLVAAALSSTAALQALLAHAQFANWLSSLVLTSEYDLVREKAVEGMYQICKSVREGTTPLPTTVLLQQLLQYLPSITPTTRTCAQYFELVNRLLQDACAGVGGASPRQFKALLVTCTEMIHRHPIVETTAHPEVEDQVLIGLMQLVTTLVSKDHEFKTLAGLATTQGGGDLVSQVFYQCLFEIPEPNQAKQAVTPPRCKSLASRGGAFKLLEELARNHPDNMKQLVYRLIAQHNLAEPRRQWSYLPSGYEKGSVGYVGLKNLGATCYMNSLMQQFYMIPEFRRGILTAPDRQEDKRESLLHQFQAIFTYLQESEKKFYDPKDFCKAYKYDGQPMNPAVQMDADEFFNMLFDKVETLLKGSPQDHILKNFFGGTMLNQIISKECEHTSEREEGFFSFSVEVKGKKKLEDSLELFVQGDVLEGDNKYMCSTCGKKVDALKRCCLKGLPNNLIIHLKRFEFDFESMRRTKLNDHCEFPTRLSLEPYTKEGLHRREQQQAGKAVEPLHPLSYYEYELSGILVHTGTAESGHYYSFIKERGANGRWYQFNDVLVEPFDPADIPAQCFGGYESVQSWDSAQGKRVTRNQQRPNNAYMLFYSKVEPNPLGNEQRTESTSSAVTAHSELFRQVWEENIRFLYDKHIFDPSYTHFVQRVLSLYKASAHNNDYAHSLDYVVQDYKQPQPRVFDPIFASIELGTRFLIETLAHAKERDNLNEIVELLSQLYQHHVPGCRWLLETSLANDCAWLKQMLFHSPVPEVREKYVKLLALALNGLAAHERALYDVEVEDVAMQSEAMEIERRSDDEIVPLAFEKSRGDSTSVIVRFMEHVMSLLKEANNHWRYFNQYFLVFEEFAALGAAERQFLLKHKAITVLADYYLQDDAPRLNKKAKPNKKSKTEKQQLSNMKHTVGTIATLVRGCVPRAPTAEDGKQVPSDSVTPYQLTGPALVMSAEDWALISSDIFLERVIGDGIHPTAASELLCHLCYENEAVSMRVLDLLNNGINKVNYEQFKPYFVVYAHLLRMQDSLHAARVEHGIRRYLEVIKNNLKYKNATYHAVRLILELMPGLPVLRRVMFETMELWIEDLLFYKTYEELRLVTETMLLYMVPELPGYNTQLPKEDVLSDHPADEPTPVVFVGLESDPLLVDARFVKIYTAVLGLFPLARLNATGDQAQFTRTPDEGYPSGYWRLLSMFRFLQWGLTSPREKQLFNAHFETFFKLFSAVDVNMECDLNKLALVQYWNQALEGNEEGLKLIMQDDKVYTRFFSYFISLRACPAFYSFNDESLPHYYGIVDRCAAVDVNFLERMLAHHNWDWTMRFLYLESAEYPRTADVLFRILMRGYNELPRIRQATVKQVFTSLDKSVNQALKHLLRLLTFVVESPFDDKFILLEKKLLQHFTKIVLHHTWVDEQNALSPLLITVLDVFQKVGAVLAESEEEEERIAKVQTELANSWNNKGNLIEFIVTVMKEHANQENFVRVCRQLLLTLAQIDDGCLELVITGLRQQHLLSQVDVNDKMETEEPAPASQLHYVEFIQQLASLAIEDADEAIAAHTVALVHYSAIESLSLPPTASRAVVATLAQFWQLPEDHELRQALLQDAALITFVSQLLSKHTEHLSTADTLKFTQQIFPGLVPRLSPDDRQNISAHLSSKLNAMAVTDDDSAQHLICVLHALVIAFHDTELKTSLVASCKNALVSLSNSVASLNTAEQNKIKIKELVASLL
jgi:ubiquitin carboxyl-terminal hydrolase 34